ncbi:MAG: AIR synthase-related protein, partial [Cutibacterium granulosum]|nr:AIR synthase-related protein [Cutibacterium granulosum]
VSQSDIEETLNMGVGMVIALPDDQVPEALEFLAGRGLTAWQCGTVASRESSDVPAVSLLGGYSMD